MKILILVLSADFPPYNTLMETSMLTWDTIEVEDMETVFYSDRSTKPDTNKIIYLPIEANMYTMNKKLMMAFEWALANKEFDFIARPHSCIYVNKGELKDYIQSLPKQNVFSGLQVIATPTWMWGGIGFVFSRDVVEKFVQNKVYMRDDLMEDMSISYLANYLEIPYTQGRGCSIEKKKNGWMAMCYGTDSLEFTDFDDIKKIKGQYFYRVKQDQNRTMDLYIMNELFKALK